MKKKILGLVVILSMILLFSHTISATEIVDSGNCGRDWFDNLTWTLDSDGVLTISGEGQMRQGYSEYSVPWKEHRSEIKEVIISEGVQDIMPYAF